MENSDTNIFRGPKHRESFSFSCYDFNSNSNSNSNSSFAIFSSSDEEYDDDNESYIEICLEPKTSTQNEGEKSSSDDENNEEMDLRISFASSIPFPQLISSTIPSKTLDDNCSTEIEAEANTSSSSSSSSSTFSFSTGTTTSTSSCSGGPTSDDSSARRKYVKRRNVQFPAVNRLLNLLVSNLKVSSSPSSEKDGRDEAAGRLAYQTSNWELVRSRKASKVTAAMNGGMMKLLIKFKSIKIRTILSYVKLQKVTSPQDKKNKSEGSSQNYQKLFKPVEKLSVQREERQKQSGNFIKNSVGRDEEKSKVMEINIDAIKGVIEAVGMSIGRKDRQTKSCPTSHKSSPIHREVVISESKNICAGENSVQAAIAHCKRSFGQTPC